MPLVRIDLCRGKSPAYRAALRDGVYRALASAFETPEDDRFAVVTEHDPENLDVDPGYLGISRSRDAVVIQITVSATRGVTQKALFAAIAANLAAAPGLRPEDVIVILIENRREDWSFGAGIAQYVA